MPRVLPDTETAVIAAPPIHLIVQGPARAAEIIHGFLGEHAAHRPGST